MTEVSKLGVHQMDIDGLSKEEIFNFLKSIGEKLGFSVQREVNTGTNKVDLAWFDNRFRIDWYKEPKRKELKLEGALLVPVVGFEVEEKTAQRKILRGDIDSLNSLYPILGVLVLSRKIKETTFRRQKKVTGSEEKAKQRMEKWFETTVRYAKNVASMNPYRRIVVLTDEDVEKLASNMQVQLV